MINYKQWIKFDEMKVSFYSSLNIEDFVNVCEQTSQVFEYDRVDTLKGILKLLDDFETIDCKNINRYDARICIYISDKLSKSLNDTLGVDVKEIYTFTYCFETVNINTLDILNKIYDGYLGLIFLIKDKKSIIKFRVFKQKEKDL